ncbi:RHS repeat-associated core domain-containing protein, partial [Longispora fulva]|uniref:RHS repeat-associated core domain-containing protein n=1 Tax=Longispora fulva TaxID=619741 RepID=UPI003626391C
MRRRILLAGLGLISVLALLPAPPPLAVQAAPPAVAGRDAAPTNTRDSGGHPATAPTVDPAPAPVLPPAGSPERERLDRFTAESQAVRERISARENPVRVEAVDRPAEQGGVPARRFGKAAEGTAAAVDPCAPNGSEQWFAQYADGAVLVTPTANATGSARLSLTNRGSATWPAGRTYLGYHLFDANGNPVAGDYPKTALPGAVPTGATATMNAAIAPLAPGVWRIGWDVWVDGLGWFSGNGVCAFTVQYTIRNQAPNLSLQSPPAYGTVTTLTPRLSVDGADPDGWPGQLTYQFRLCHDQALTSGCVESPWVGLSGWRVPAGTLAWNDLFYWSARVNDGELTTPPSGWPAPNQVTTVVPAAETWRTVGAGLGLTNIAGVILPYGMWIHPETDASVQGVGLPLQVQRTYSTAARYTTGAFGNGWLSMFDASARYSQDFSQLTVTYPDGRQEIFARQADGWVTRAETGSTNRLKTAGDRIVVTGSGGEVLTFLQTGELESVAATGVGRLEFRRDGTGLVDRVTQRPSGRSIDVGWSHAGGAGCATTWPPMVSSIDLGPAEDGGQTVRWAYTYKCGELVKVCDPLNTCTQYEPNYTATSPWWRKSAAGRTMARPLETFAFREQTLDGRAERAFLRVDTPDNKTVFLDVWRPRAGQLDGYMNTYNPFGGVTVQVASADNGATPDTYRFDELNRLRELKHGGYAQTGTTSRRWGYNATNGQFTGFTDENQHGVETLYDPDGNLRTSLRSRDLRTVVASTAYYDQPSAGGGWLMSSTYTTPRQDNPYQDQMFRYDGQDRLIERRGNPTPENPAGALTTYEYDTYNLTKVTSAGQVTSYRHDPRGDLTSVTDPAGRTVGYEYDRLGRRTAQVETSTAYPAGLRTAYTLDRAGRVVQELPPATVNEVTGVRQQPRICRTYDADGLVTRVVTTAAAQCPAPTAGRLAGDRTTDTRYDNAGRPLELTDPAGGKTRYEYGVGYQGTVLTDYVRVITPAGHWTTSWYDHAGRLLKVERTTLGPDALYQYDAAGRLVEESDALGRRTRYDWTDDDLNYRAVRLGVRQADGSTHDVELFRREFDGEGRITSEKVGTRLSTSTFDGEGKLVDTVLDPAGLNRRVHRVYDARGFLTGETATDGGRTENRLYVPDATGHVDTATVLLDPTHALVTMYHRDQRGLPVRVMDPRGWFPNADPDEFTTDNRYDEYGRLVRQTAPAVTVEDVGDQPATARPETAYGYNAFGDLTEVRDQLGNVTETVYDDAGRAVLTRGPAVDGSRPTVRRTYDAEGQLATVVDPRGNQTDYHYDEYGQVWETLGPDAGQGRPSTRAEHDRAGQLTATVDPTGARTEYEYDALGRQVAATQVVRQPSGPALRFTTTSGYDDQGNLTSTVSPSGARSAFAYNAAGELTASWLPGVTNATIYGRDLAGRVTRIQDPAGRITEYEYDLAGRQVLTRHRGPDGTELDVSRFEPVDPSGVQVTVSGTGGRTRQVLDALGRVTTEIGPTGIVTRTGYDRLGRVTRQTDGRGDSTLYAWTALGTVATVTEPATTAYPSLADRQFSYGYDAGGFLTKVVKPGGVIVEPSYDALGRLVSEHGHGPGVPDNTRTFGYDLAGRLTSASHPGGTLTYTWSDRNRLLTASGPAGGTGYQYDADGNPARQQDPVGVTTLTWRPDGRPATATDPLTGATRTWNYSPTTGDPLGHTVANGPSTQWSLDGRGRIKSLTAFNPASQAVYQASYGYDPNGNVTSKTIGFGAPGGGGSYGYDLADRMTRWTPDDGGGTHEYIWDAASNRTAEKVAGTQVGSWTYDQRDRLTGAHTGGRDLTYAYSPRGTLASSGGTTLTFDAFDQLLSYGTTAYHYDALGRLADRSGAAFGYAGLDRQPVTAPGAESYARMPGTGQPLAGRVGGQVGFPLADAHGDVVAWQPTQGPVLTGSTNYDPFGLKTGGTGLQSALGFQGGWTDPASGLVQMDARWYDPAAGGFVSRDSLDARDRYGYTGGNPMSRVDTTGRFQAPIPPFSLSAVLGGAATAGEAAGGGGGRRGLRATA